MTLEKRLLPALPSPLLVGPGSRLWSSHHLQMSALTGRASWGETVYMLGVHNFFSL